MKRKAVRHAVCHHKAIYPTIAIAGHITKNSITVGFFMQSSNRNNRMQLVNCPNIGQSSGKGKSCNDKCLPFLGPGDLIPHSTPYHPSHPSSARIWPRVRFGELFLHVPIRARDKTPPAEQGTQFIPVISRFV